MSGTLPTTPAPSSITPRSITQTRVSTAHSMKQQVRSSGAHRWGFKITWSKLKRADFAPIDAFMVAQNGQYETFTIVPTVIGTRRASGTSAVTVQTATASGRSVPITGATAAEEIGLAGDFVKFAGHLKVYKITADAVADVSGNAVLAIEPTLFAPVALGEAVILDDVPVSVGSNSDLVETPIVPGILYDYSLDVVERP